MDSRLLSTFGRVRSVARAAYISASEPFRVRQLVGGISGRLCRRDGHSTHYWVCARQRSCRVHLRCNWSSHWLRVLARVATWSRSNSVWGDGLGTLLFPEKGICREADVDEGPLRVVICRMPTVPGSSGSMTAIGRGIRRFPANNRPFGPPNWSPGCCHSNRFQMNSAFHLTLGAEYSCATRVDLLGYM